MTEQEWLAHLDAFGAQELTTESVRDLFDAAFRRFNSIIIGHANRANDDTRAQAQRADRARVDINDLRTILADVVARVTELEQLKTRAANDASNDA
jgi:hypothetical protein